MCLLVIAWQAHPRYPLVVAANRDEFHERPTAPMAKWPPPNDLLAGRDLRANGTWLALDRQRRFGVVTNFRDLQRPQPQAPSRGGLIPRYLPRSMRYPTRSRREAIARRASEIHPGAVAGPAVAALAGVVVLGVVVGALNRHD